MKLEGAAQYNEGGLTVIYRVNCGGPGITNATYGDWEEDDYGARSDYHVSSLQVIDNSNTWDFTDQDGDTYEVPASWADDESELYESASRGFGTEGAENNFEFTGLDNAKTYTVRVALGTDGCTFPPDIDVIIEGVTELDDFTPCSEGLEDVACVFEATGISPSSGSITVESGEGGEGQDWYALEILEE